jgi:hypothetical protein
VVRLGPNTLAVPVRFVGVADIASVRFSLPANLLEPRPNLGKLIRAVLFEATRYLTELDNLLEYWNYLDRPDTFAR